MEVEVELQGMSKVPSNFMVLPNSESVNDEAFDNSRLLEKVLERNNMLLALKRVISNKGIHGVDGMKTDELREYIKKHRETIKTKLLENKYNPSPVRRKEISKLDGGVRFLGIPTAQDRLIQQALAQLLSKILDVLVLFIWETVALVFHVARVDLLIPVSNDNLEGEILSGGNILSIIFCHRLSLLNYISYENNINYSLWQLS